MPALLLAIIIVSAVIILIGMGIRKLWPWSGEELNEVIALINMIALVFGGIGAAGLLCYYMFKFLAPLIN